MQDHLHKITPELSWINLHLSSWLIFFVVLAHPPSGQLFCQESRGWFLFHKMLNQMTDLRIQDRVDIIFALQDELDEKLPVDYKWNQNEIDGLRSLILTGFSFDMTAAQIARGCAVLFDSYQLGAFHPEILDFLEITLTGKVTPERLALLTKLSRKLRELPSDLKMQFISEIIQNDWSTKNIVTTARFLKISMDMSLDLNSAVIAGIHNLKQNDNQVKLQSQLNRALDELKRMKRKKDKQRIFRNMANRFKTSGLPNEFLNELTSNAIDQNWGKQDFLYILQTLDMGIKNKLSYEKLSYNISTRLAQTKNRDSNITQKICKDEYQKLITEKVRKEAQQIRERQTDKARKLSTVQGNTSSEFSHQKLMDIVQMYLGTPYCWGGTSRSGIDCSGLTQCVFFRLGIPLPRTSYKQFLRGQKVSLQKLRAGDLVFFSTNYFGMVSHVGIYLGNNQFCHASSSRGVTISNLNKYYYRTRFIGARRFF